MNTITHTLSAGVVLVATFHDAQQRQLVREALARYGYLIGIDETVTPAEWVQRIRGVHAHCWMREAHCAAVLGALC